ncbi:MAG: polysaccharide pyruvyl transferase family protein, partial [Bryobacteraceae bacterium]
MSFTLTLIRDFVTDLRRTPSVAFRRLQLKKSHQLAVGYIGWVGHNNLGDEAMFGAVGKAMSRFEVLDLLPEPGEHLLTKLGLGGPAIFRAVLLGGGTLINPLYLRVAQMIRKFNLPLYTVGTGIGNPGFGASSPDHSLEGWADILRESPLVSVRGPLSAHRLRQAGIAHTEIIGDPALAFTPETEPPFRSRRQLVINLTQESGSRYGTGDYEIFRQVGKLA